MSTTETVTYAWENDTAHATKAVALPVIQWNSDFGVNLGQSATTLKNAKAPIGVPESFTFEARSISNIYANRDDIEYSQYDANKKGISVLGDLKESVEFTGEDGKSVVLPFDFHFVLKSPVSNRVSDQILEDVYKRMVSAAVDAAGNYLLGRMVRGITDPRQ